ncbi:hypothetical protein LCGC14_1913330 [marine sediment metagenome]|uniref:Viral late gene transcription factor 3 zinc ribbon domain-containing protein n=1 Tax=marine sediment metagenome TaxID=412755 RepID=A0A0F9I703_9ZZZZ
MLCPNCGNRMFDDGLDDLLSCGACGNYEKKRRIISPYSAPGKRNRTRVICAGLIGSLYTVAPFAGGNA